MGIAPGNPSALAAYTISTLTSLSGPRGVYTGIELIRQPVETILLFTDSPTLIDVSSTRTVAPASDYALLFEVSFTRGRSTCLQVVHIARSCLQWVQSRRRSCVDVCSSLQSPRSIQASADKPALFICMASIYATSQLQTCLSGAKCTLLLASRR